MIINYFGKIKTLGKLLKRKFSVTPEDEKIDYDGETIYAGHFQIKYRGVNMIRCPFDYVIYQMMINEVKPDLVIEIGTNHGGTTLYIADLMDKIDHGMVHSIDIVKKSDRLVQSSPRIKLFSNGWDKYDLNETKGFNKIIVIEDASHMYEDCIGSLNKFSKLVSIGSYYIVEDGIISSHGRDEGYNGGPLRAIREFLKSNSNFNVDRKYCDMFGKNATFNVNGYLKRIK
ncbi:MAG: CmcI family methyltransferase [Patescibacteria group bacterium]